MLTGLSWQEAQNRLLAWARQLGSDKARLRHALFHYAASEVSAQAPYPPHNLAEERGYALSYDSLKACWDKNEPATFRFTGNLGGGKTFERQVEPGQTMLAEAGTLLPDAFDVVVPEAEVERKDNEIILKTRPERFSGVMPRGRFVREGDVLLPQGRRIACAGQAVLYSQEADEVEVVRKPIIGSLILGSGLHDPRADKVPKDSVPELLSPIVRGLCARWQLPFISLGTQEAHIRLDEAVLHGAEQAEVMVVSGILSSAQWQDLARTLENDWELLIKGLSHPLCGRLCVAVRDGRWLFFLPYHPPLIQALFALLVYPFVMRVMGDPEGYVPFVSARSAESVEVKNSRDDIWIGRERVSRESVDAPEVCLICQISAATLASIVEGTCFALTHMVGDRIESGSKLTMIRY